jgi:sporulation protein YlmC with PRC-barrel domain
VSASSGAAGVRLEDLHLGSSVIATDGHKVGTLSRFVVRTEGLRLTHIVVDTGIFRSGDWNGAIGLPHDRLIPLEAVQTVDRDRVHISMTADEFKQLSVDYADERFAPIGDAEPGKLDLSDVRRFISSIPGEPGPYVMYERSALPAGELEIKKDSPVWRLNPHQKIGEVEDLLYDERTKQVASLVIRRGFVFSKDVVLPVQHIVEVVADIVRVDIDDAALEGLREYLPED